MNETIDYRRSAAKVLTANFSLSILYELYRATVKAGASRHDSIQGFVAQLPLYAAAGLVVGLLQARHRVAPWIAAAFCATVIVISIGYYNPVIMLERQPGIVDWIEDLVFTSLLFVAATQTLNHIAVQRRTNARK